MRKIAIITALALVLCGAFAISAQAYTIDFEIAAIQDGASVSYAGGATNLVGSNIVIDKITGIGTPLNAGNAASLTSTDGLWNFTSGTFTGSVTDHWQFNSSANSSMTITGHFTNGLTTIIDPVPLQNNNWVFADVHRIGAENAYAVTGFFTDTKSDDLLTYFGVTNPQSATFTFGFKTATDILPPAPFDSTSVQSGDISQVPVPPSMVLLGTGLLGLVGLRFRRKLS